MDTHLWDVLVVGAGIAGEMAALEASRRGKSVAILSRVEPFSSHSRNPRGVNLALSAGDDWRRQADDIWNDSHFLADWDAVELVCRQGPEIVLREFRDLLDTDERGEIIAHDYAGTPRGIMSGNYTGLNFLRRSYGLLAQRDVPFLTNRVLTSLIVESGQCMGLAALNVVTGELEAHLARATILCTGGFGYVYQNTAHGPENAGAGHAVAYLAGVPLKDVEFIYFHHTNVFGTPLIITEGAFNRGLRLFNRYDERFLARYDPVALEGTQRYYLKRYMALELDAGRGVEGKFFWADYTHMGDEAFIDAEFPRTRKACLDALGLDIVRDRIPVVPGVQATLGGIEIDLEGRTCLPGLYAAGECACPGVHGADWRVGNPMLAALVFGTRAGTAASADLSPTDGHASHTLEQAATRALKRESDHLNEIDSRTDGVPYHLVRAQLRRTMTQDVAVLRDAAKLEAALATIRQLQEAYRGACLWHHGLPFNQQLVEYLDLGHMLLVAEAVANAANARRESRGNHWRRDYPDRDDGHWQRHSVQRYTPDGPALDYVPVKLGQFETRGAVAIR